MEAFYDGLVAETPHFMILTPFCSENLTFEGLRVPSWSHLGSKMTSGGGQDSQSGLGQGQQRGSGQQKWYQDSKSGPSKSHCLSELWNGPEIIPDLCQGVGQVCYSNKSYD